ncbi:arylsulfatase [Pontibacter mucosus]|uniref:Arylsulfatase n=1 Tax=Pontibacter mucosus TaxID=1649266 RepID=A0A2T5YKU2_9BACT|nr:arylsulfatase [Pontibacter mucosus]PTX19936.1 arylsulfatase [Pontibacter mucosus]
MKKVSFFLYLIIIGLLFTVVACRDRKTEDKSEAKTDNNTNAAANRSRPNILLIVVDDLGYSDLSPFGGEIRTPNIQRLADNGLIVQNCYTSPLCAPSRAMFLSGMDNHISGVGAMPPFQAASQYMQPGYEGYLNDRVMTLPEVLRENGYHTYMSGKWHLGHEKGRRPFEEGFERSFSFLGGGASHFSNIFPLGPEEVIHTVYYDDSVQVKKLPDDFYSSNYYADKMIQYITEQKDDAPFFGYLAFTAPHDPLHVPDEWMDKYKGAYDKGYDAIRQVRMDNMKKLGLIPKDLPINPGSGEFKKWNELSAQEKKLQARRMELYAAMLEIMDLDIGRVLEALQKAGKLENTIVMLIGDNGANPKDPSFYKTNMKPFDNSLENMGKPNSFVSLEGAWAEVTATPYAYFKTTTGEGGIRVPFIISGPGVTLKGVDATNKILGTDIMPTLLDITGIERPDTYKNNKLAAMTGTTFNEMLGKKGSTVRDEENGFGVESLENKAYIKGDWKIRFVMPPFGDGKTWHLFNLKDDPREQRDLAKQNPDKLNELLGDWGAYTQAVGYIQFNGGRAYEVLGPKNFFKSELDSTNRALLEKAKLEMVRGGE